MGQELDMFSGDLPAEFKDLLGQLEPDTNITGGDFVGGRRISIKGSVFRQIVNGEEVAKLEDRKLNMVIVKCSPMHRQYYEGKYKEGDNSPPVCWSSDSKVPDESVIATDKQSESCESCPQHIKGSGEGESRACRFSQKIAVLLDGEIITSKPYVMSIPATSIFGSDKDSMGMQAYARYLASHKTPTAAVITEFKFDTDAATPKLCFRPVRPLSKEELEVVAALQKDPTVSDMVELTIFKSEGKKPTGPLFPEVDEVEDKPKKDKKPKKEAVDSDEADEVEEPKLQTKTRPKEKPVESNEDLADILDGWDDED